MTREIFNVAASALTIVMIWACFALEERRRKALKAAFEAQKGYLEQLQRSWDMHVLIGARHQLFLLSLIPRWYLTDECRSSIQELETLAQKIEARLAPLHPEIPTIGAKPERPRACA